MGPPKPEHLILKVGDALLLYRDSRFFNDAMTAVIPKNAGYSPDFDFGRR
jgi:hypothetical protein